MANPPALMPLNEHDYVAIEEAVMETNRGRWFLAEYAKRNRQADTNMLLGALGRIEAAIRGEREGETVDRIRFDLLDMAKAIARTKAEIATIKPDADHHGKFGEATEELDSIVSATEAATSDILAAAEQIQEVAWTLREQGLEAEVCDLVDAKATDIYTACSFQDLTGQRSRKVVQVLRYLEGRINAMIDIWGLDNAMAAEAAETAKARDREAALLNGPAQPGLGLDQADIDVVMGPAAEAGRAAAGDVRRQPAADGPPRPAPAAMRAAEAATPPRPAPGPAAMRAVEQPAPARPAPEPAARPTPRSAPVPETAAPVLAPQAPPRTAPAARPIPQKPPHVEAPSTSPANDPLAPIVALSAEEKIALFS